jgi:nitrate reductase (cytochrome), electron transfer subunit
MTRTGRPAPVMLRVAGIAAGIALLVASVALVARWLDARDEAARFPPPGRIAEFGEPIAAEAEVFRTPPTHGAVPPGIERREQAHLRTHAMFRTLRAYPGAPPRIPHGLTASEFHDASCQTCHERGGYVARFTSYAPVTPHPEHRGGCLQCHAPDDAIIGIEPPDGRPGSVCLQCHVLDRPTPSFRPTAWRAPDWPALGNAALPGSPPPIPHTLHMRGNCAACHVGAGAVEEIRTTHPERANCRQCHMQVETDAGAFSRPLDRGGAP